MGSQSMKSEKKVLNNDNEKLKKNKIFEKTHFSYKDDKPKLRANPPSGKLTIEEEKAIENLVEMGKSKRMNFMNQCPVLPSIDFIQCKLQCKDCRNPIEAHLIQILIYCGYIGDYSLLNNFDRTLCPSKKGNFNMANDITNQNQVKVLEKSPLSNKKEKEIPKSKIENLEISPVSIESNDKIGNPPVSKSKPLASKNNGGRLCQLRRKLKKEDPLEVKPEEISRPRVRNRKIRNSIAILDDDHDSSSERSITGEVSFTEISTNNEKETVGKAINTLVCPFCKNSFTSKNGLNYHIKYVHSEEKSKVVKPFQCPFSNCNKKYKNKNGLYYHLTHHHSDESEDIEALYADCIGGKKD